MKIAVSCDSVSDLNPEQIRENNIKISPFIITLGDNNYYDGIDINNQMIFDYVAKTGILPKTSAINSYDYKEHFESLLKEYEAVIHINISSEISSSHQNAVLAANELQNVFVIDTLSLTTGIGLLALYAAELVKKGENVKTIAQKLNERKHKVQVSFVIEKLDYLHKGGRCSGVALLGANILRIHPSVEIKKGKMVMKNKYRGKMEDVVVSYINDTFKEYNTPDLSKIFLTYSTATPEMIAAARKAIESNFAFKQIIESTAGSTVTSHCGKNTIGILYFNDGK